MQQIMRLAVFGHCLLFLLMQLIVPAQNTTCFYCDAPNNKTCDQKEVKCPNGSSCVTVSEENCVDGKIFYSLRKMCARNWPCGYIYAIVDSKVYVDSYLDCCIGERCNSGGYNLPRNTDAMAKGKGVLCPVCYKYGTLDGCNATRSTVCLREDDLCVKFIGTVLRPDGVPYNISVQGCSCKLACKYDYSEMAGLKITSYKEYKCYTPKNSAPQSDEEPPF